MTDTERTPETIVDGILAAMKSDPYEMDQFIRGILFPSMDGRRNFSLLTPSNLGASMQPGKYLREVP